MKKITIDELMKTFPYSIRFEIVKKRLESIFDLEYKFFEIMKKRGVDFYALDARERYELCLNYENHYNADSIYQKMKSFAELMEKAELPNDMLIELYQWAKKRRIELGLKDNLFNLFDEYIFEAYKYKELNEEINGRMVL